MDKNFNIFNKVDLKKSKSSKTKFAFKFRCFRKCSRKFKMFKKIKMVTKVSKCSKKKLHVQKIQNFQSKKSNKNTTFLKVQKY